MGDTFRAATAEQVAKYEAEMIPLDAELIEASKRCDGLWILDVTQRMTKLRGRHRLVRHQGVWMTWDLPPDER
jgi:hypothetical protein